jgi:hypothetical protein
MGLSTSKCGVLVIMAILRFWHVGLSLAGLWGDVFACRESINGRQSRRRRRATPAGKPKSGQPATPIDTQECTKHLVKKTYSIVLFFSRQIK